MPGGSGLVDVIVGGVPTVREKGRVKIAPTASVMRAVKLYVADGGMGVPET